MNKIFHSCLTIENPVIKNHSFRGQTILPGLAYIDMLYQLARDGLHLDYREHSLKRLAIYHPLIVSGEKPVRIKISFSKKQAYWDIKVEDDEKKYITAELHREAAPEEVHIDIEEIKKSAPGGTDIEDLYREAGKSGLVHSEINKAEGIVFLTDTGCLIDLRIDKDFSDNNAAFLFHPTLIDGAGMAAMKLISTTVPRGKEDAFVLLLSFESFYGKESFRDHCYVRIDKSSIKPAKDIFSYNMEFYNQDGNRVAELKGITAKLLRSQKKDQKISTTNVSDDTAGKPAENSTLLNKTGLSTGAGEEETGIGTGGKGETAVEPILIKIFLKYLNKSIGPAEMNLGFYELGLESSQLLDLVKDIEDSFHISLSPSLLFEYSTMSDLAGYLEKKLPDEHGESYPVFSDQGELNLFPDREQPVLSPGNYEFHEDEPYLQDHLVFEQPALMGLTYPPLVIESYLQNNPGAFPFELRNIRFIGGPVGLNKNEKVSIQVEFNQGKKREGFHTTYYVNNPAQKKTCCSGEYIGPADTSPDIMDIDTMIKQSVQIRDEVINKSYDIINDFRMGAMLRTIESAYKFNSTTLLGKVNLAGKLKKGNILSLTLDPLLLNSCYLLANPDAVDSGVTGNYSDNIYIPLTIERIIVFRPMTEQTLVVKTERMRKADFYSFDAMILTETGEMIAEVINANLQRVRSPEILHQVTPVNSNKVKKDHNEMDIAIVGIAGRYPGANDLEAFWDNLKEGKDSITEIPRDRWNWEEYFDEDKNKVGKIYSKWGGFIEGVYEFDPLFFNMTPREAEFIDPQERLFLECVYNTLEDAGYTRAALHGTQGVSPGARVGVYVGVMYEEYQLFGAQEQVKGRMFAIAGNPSSIANRASYVFNFHGPSMAVDTMCSSSITAIYLACQGLEKGDCDAAIAGGVNVSLHPNKYLLLSLGKFASSKGRCESFGKGGDGYVPGEGVGAVLLKQLSKALSDSDHIYGVIKGSMLNAGGKTSGFTVPDPSAQGSVILDSIKRSGVNARTISYIEAHGTGTSLGDPIEVAGLVKAFRHFTQDKQFCAIGSVKSNVGHLESAAGIAAVTKVVLQMKHRKLVPSIHSKELNPNINFDDTPFYVQQEFSEWKSDYPRRAGISSFGAGGSNAHMIMEEYVPDEPGAIQIVSPEKPVVIVLSAKDGEKLKIRAKNLLQAIGKEEYGDEKLPGIAYTLQTGREGMDERLGFTAATITELKEKLECYLEKSAGNEGKIQIHKDLYQGQVKQDKETVSLFTADEDLLKAVDNWIKKGKYGKILSLWIKGLNFDWQRLYGGIKPRRISLPAYPFARERYWIKETIEKYQLQNTQKAAADGNPFSTDL